MPLFLDWIGLVWFEERFGLKYVVAELRLIEVGARAMTTFNVVGRNYIS